MTAFWIYLFIYLLLLFCLRFNYVRGSDSSVRMLLRRANHCHATQKDKHESGSFSKFVNGSPWLIDSCVFEKINSKPLHWQAFAIHMFYNLSVKFS